jgi:hypothetical protein
MRPASITTILREGTNRCTSQETSLVKTSSYCNRPCRNRQTRELSRKLQHILRSVSETLPDGKNIMDNVAFHRSNVVKSVAVREASDSELHTSVQSLAQSCRICVSSMKARYRKLRPHGQRGVSHYHMSLESIDSTMTSNLFDHARCIDKT